jgi:hypothetical protein
MQVALRWSAETFPTHGYKHATAPRSGAVGRSGVSVPQKLNVWCGRALRFRSRRDQMFIALATNKFAPEERHVR